MDVSDWWRRLSFDKLFQNFGGAESDYLIVTRP